jgi:hypothetical protein
VNVRVISQKGDISHIEGAFESNNQFHKVLIHQNHIIGINYTFAKAFVQKINDPSQWVVLDISDQDINKKVKKHLEEDLMQESTGGSP